MLRINRTWQEAARFVGIPICLPPDPGLLLWDSPAFAAYQEGKLTNEAYHRALGRELGIASSEAAQVSVGVLLGGYEGAQELVEELKAKGFQTGCLSNTVADHWSAMVETDLYSHIRNLDIKVASHLAGLAKPDEAIFRLFEDRSGSRGSSIAYFDDLAENVAVAIELGWLAFCVDPTIETIPQIRMRLHEIGWL
jgi:putative hydrolase of the HAD superfamily